MKLLGAFKLKNDLDLYFRTVEDENQGPKLKDQLGGYCNRPCKRLREARDTK